MELVKQLEFLNPTQINEEIHIIGLGAMGSTVATMLARMGFNYFNLYDFDTVEEKNICNQTFSTDDVGRPKIFAVASHIKAINPDAEIYPNIKGWTEGMPLSGYVFICVDSIELRNKIVDDIICNPNITAVFDLRMGLTDAQVYTAKWSNETDKKKLKASMQFTDEEAKAAMPVSACGTSLSVRPTVVMAVAYCIANMVNIVKQSEYKTSILFDAFSTNIIAF